MNVGTQAFGNLKTERQRNTDYSYSKLILIESARLFEWWIELSQEVLLYQIDNSVVRLAGTACLKSCFQISLTEMPRDLPISPGACRPQ